MGNVYIITGPRTHNPSHGCPPSSRLERMCVQIPHINTSICSNASQSWWLHFWNSEHARVRVGKVTTVKTTTEKRPSARLFCNLDYIRFFFSLFIQPSIHPSAHPSPPSSSSWLIYNACQPSILSVLNRSQCCIWNGKIYFFFLIASFRFSRGHSDLFPIFL